MKEKLAHIRGAYMSVVEANMIAGKNVTVSSPNYVEARRNQIQRIVEELEIEMKEKTLKPAEGETTLVKDAAFYKQILDDICDTFVTTAFLHHMENSESNPQALQSIGITEGGNALASGMTLADVINGKLEFNDVDQLLNDLISVMVRKNNYVDFIGGIEAVNSNNLSKFLKTTEEDSLKIVEDSVLHYNKRGELCRYRENMGFYVILRESDNKYMKPLNFVPVDLEPFVLVTS